MPAKKKSSAKRATRSTASRSTSSSRPTGKRAGAKARTRPRAERISFREEPERERATADEIPTASSFHPGMSAQCLVCPICMSLYALQQSRPEAMQHLMAAGHELFLAFRALVESQAERWEQVNTLQRISVR